MWKMLGPAKKVSAALSPLSDQRHGHEILRLDDASTGIVVDIDGIDYMLTMTALPKQRERPRIQ
jgi:hypothetical protein